MNKRIVGVYSIYCERNKKIYIGSSINILKRWSHHKDDLRSNTHHSKHLQRAWNRYKEESFVFKILEETSMEERINREQFYIDLFKSYLRQNGFNLYPKAEGSSGYKFSKQHIENLKKSHLGYHHTEIQKQRIADAHRGEKSHRAKLTTLQVQEIKKCLLSGNSQSSLSKEYNVTRSTISSIWKEKSWSHIEPHTPGTKIIPAGEKHHNSKLTHEMVFQIKNQYKSGKRIFELVKEYNANYTTISDIIKGRTWKTNQDSTELFMS